MQEEITKEDWVQWLGNPVTNRFFQMVKDRREEAIEYLAFGSANSMQKQNITVGAINAYTHILGVKYEGGEDVGTRDSE